MVGILYLQFGRVIPTYSPQLLAPYCQSKPKVLHNSWKTLFLQHPASCQFLLPYNNMCPPSENGLAPANGTNGHANGTANGNSNGATSGSNCMSALERHLLFLLTIAPQRTKGSLPSLRRRIRTSPAETRISPWETFSAMFHGSKS